MTAHPVNIRPVHSHDENRPRGCVSLRDLAAAAGSIRPRAGETRHEMIILLEKHLQDPDANVREKVRSSLLRLAA